MLYSSEGPYVQIIFFILVGEVYMSVDVKAAFADETLSWAYLVWAKRSTILI